MKKVINTVVFGQMFFAAEREKILMKSRTCKFVSAQRTQCLRYILKGVKHYDSEPDFALEKI